LASRYNPRFTRAAAVVVAALLGAACTKPPLGPSYEEYVARWVNSTEANLVSAWGIPGKSHSLETGGRIIEYTKSESGEVICTTRFTIDETGRIVKYWYRGSKCRAPESV
jgi:hypothetical protein